MTGSWPYGHAHPSVQSVVIDGRGVAMLAVASLELWRAPSTSQGPRLVGVFETLKYPLGTTSAGVDLTAAIIHSTPDILLMVVAGGVWATGVALLVGTVAGYKGGRTDTVLMSVSDFFMAIPGLPLVIILAITFSPENPIFVGAILTIRENSYVEASRVMGVITPQIILKDVIPNLLPYVTMNFVFAARPSTHPRSRCATSLPSRWVPNRLTATTRPPSRSGPATPSRPSTSAGSH